MQLIIAEKPSVAYSIAKALDVKGKKDGYIENGNFIITWCIGHLITLAEPQSYDEKFAKWNYGDLPIIPESFKYKISGDKNKQFKVIKELMHRKDVAEVVNACDAGREGELIFRLVYNQAACKKPIKRLWISSMEESAIREGFHNLKNGSEYDNLYNSALCRLWADWIVGINATRLFSLLYRKTLNIGRVQTPTLALMADRHNKIAFFKKEKYFTVEIGIDNATAVSERIDSENTAKEIMTACEKSQAVCVSVNKEQKTQKPPKLFDLTTLQRQANKAFGYTAKQTLDYAQALYEKKLITYPRTDARFLTEDMAETAAAVIHLAAKVSPFDTCSSFFPDVACLINNSKVSDHHAIIPTMEIEKSDLSLVPKGELNILKLIICKLLCASAEPYIYEFTTAEFECGGKIFKVSGKQIISYGFKVIEKLLAVSSENEDGGEQVLSFCKGQSFAGIKPVLKEKYTVPPKPYTEDTLLSAMVSAGDASTLALRGVGNAGSKETADDAERKGLGTPATRAAILEKLVQTGFAERNGKQILPTKNGTLFISVLPDTLISADMTAEWENALTLISKGQGNPKEFIQGIKNMIAELVERYRAFDKSKENPFADKGIER